MRDWTFSASTCTDEGRTSKSAIHRSFQKGDRVHGSCRCEGSCTSSKQEKLFSDVGRRRTMKERSSLSTRPRSKHRRRRRKEGEEKKKKKESPSMAHVDGAGAPGWLAYIRSRPTALTVYGRERPDAGPRRSVCMGAAMGRVRASSQAPTTLADGGE